MKFRIGLAIDLLGLSVLVDRRNRVFVESTTRVPKVSGVVIPTVPWQFDEDGRRFVTSPDHLPPDPIDGREGEILDSLLPLSRPTPAQMYADHTALDRHRFVTTLEITPEECVALGYRAAALDADATP